MDITTVSAELSKPLDPNRVKSRKQGGQEVSYIEGWHAIAEANRIFGHLNWARETIEMREVRKDQGKDKWGNDQWRVAFICKVRITVHIGDVLTTREGSGYGSGIAKDLGDAYEGAIKEAETDAMKRALMTFGNPFGLALYDKTLAGVGAPEPEPEKTLAQSYIENRPAGKRFPSKGDSETFYKVAVQAMEMATTQMELKEFGRANAKSFEGLHDDHYAQVKIAFSERMQALPPGFQQEAAA